MKILGLEKLNRKLKQLPAAAEKRIKEAILNPGAPADRFCERVPLMRDQTVRWPNW